VSFQLADYQGDVKSRCYQAYRDGARNVMPVLPTGSGKTVIMGSIAHEYEGFGVSMAHRGQLVGQLSLALAREGLMHDIIAPDAVIRTIVGAHREEFGRDFYNARAPWKCASVQTLSQRANDLPKTWTNQVGMIHGDEGHHYLEENMWGRAVKLFPNAFGLFPTATPIRGDGIGLGRGHGGIIDTMVVGPGMRWMIDEGHLTDYHIYMPLAEDLDMEGVELTASGEFNMEKTRKRVKASKKIVGDVVKCYLEFARGMKGITFAVDVEHAHMICKAYNEAGVAAVVVQDKTPETERRAIMRRFTDGDLMQLVNVDLFGEGVDVPAVQVVSMARPTASESLYTQQFGRALRLFVSKILRAAWHTYTPWQRKQFIAESAKPRAIIIDHVGNLITHRGPPDMRQEPWTLEARAKKRGQNDAVPYRACANPMCVEPFLRIYPACPYCGWVPPIPADRSRPEFVDGDMHLYTPELLRELYGQANKFNPDSSAQIPYGWSHGSPLAQRLKQYHAASVEAQGRLRAAIGLYTPPGMDARVAARRFFHTFGVDTLSAIGLPSAEADELRQRILNKLTGVVPL
jgi:superfamily II DNA or RNA helicase